MNVHSLNEVQLCVDVRDKDKHDVVNVMLEEATSRI